MVTLRSYQVDAVNAATRLLDRGGDPLIVHATGAGKTVSMSELVKRDVEKGGNVLILAHRVELLAQIRNALTSIKIHSIRDITEWGSCNVIVTSPASVRRHLHNLPPEIFSLVIVDEAHHAVAGGHLRVINHFRGGGARVAGFTATTDRLDGVGLSNVFDKVAHEYNIRDAVADGNLVPARAIRVVVDGIDLSKVRRVSRAYAKDRDLHPKDLGVAVMPAAAISGVVVPLLELANARTVAPANANTAPTNVNTTRTTTNVNTPTPTNVNITRTTTNVNTYTGLRTIVFAVNILHMKALCAALVARGASARWVDGTMSKKSRASVLADHQAGKFQFLVNVMILTEGYNDPGVGCIAMVRPTQSRILYAQATGRGLRLAPGKTECLVLDFCGVSCDFVLVGPEDGLCGGLSGPVTRYKSKVLTKVVVKKSWWRRLLGF